eukprot:2506993-Prymnesium_polylepis.2
MSTLPVFAWRASGSPATIPPVSVLIRLLCNSRTEISSSSLPTRSGFCVSTFFTSSVSLEIGELTTRGCASTQSLRAVRSSAETFEWPFRFLTCDQAMPSSRSESLLRLAAAFLSSRLAVE